MNLDFDHSDLADADFQAVVDWIEVRVRLPRPSQPRHLRARMAAALPHWGTPPYVEAETTHPSGTAASFTFRIQDPLGPDQLMSDLSLLGQDGERPLTEGDVDVLAIEVALDVYPSARSRQRPDLALVAHYLHLHHARPPSGTVRVTGPDGGAIIWNHGDVQAALGAGQTINTGDVTSNHRSRCYVKTHDTVDGRSYAPLAPNQHRARLEVTLARERAPFATVAAWRSFDFSKLSRQLALRRSIEPDANHASPLDRLLWSVVRRGKPDSEDARSAHKRLHKSGSRADTVANKRIRTALERLTRQQRNSRSIDATPRPRVGNLRRKVRERDGAAR